MTPSTPLPEQGEAMTDFQIEPDDNRLIRRLKSAAQLISQMTDRDQRIAFQREKVGIEEDWLKLMISWNKQEEDNIRWFISKAKEYAKLYEQDDQEKWLDRADQYLNLAKETRRLKFTIGDIRQQREKVQWERKKLKQMTNQGEPERSSSRSEN